MKQSYNARCSICDNGYYMCQSCKEQMRNAPWKLYTDTSEHYKIYQILHGYTVGVYTKEEAKSKLSNVDMSDKDTYKDSIKAQIDSIMKEENKFVYGKHNANRNQDYGYGSGNDSKRNSKPNKF